MKEMETIKIQERFDGNSNANARLRKTGYLPAAIYGKGMETVSVSIKTDELRRILSKLGRNAVLTLETAEGKLFTVIIKEIQNAPVSRNYLHVDFLQVSLSEEISASVAIRIVNSESLEMKKLILNRQLDQVTVKGFPQNIPDVIDIDASKLNLGDSVKVSDLELPEGITVENEADTVVLTVSEPRVQEITEEVEEDQEVKEVEVEKAE